MNAIGNLQRVPLRDAWDNEPNNVTRWLEKNIDVLNEVIGLSISVSLVFRVILENAIDLVLLYNALSSGGAWLRKAVKWIFTTNIVSDRLETLGTSYQITHAVNE